MFHDIFFAQHCRTAYLEAIYMIYRLVSFYYCSAIFREIVTRSEELFMTRIYRAKCYEFLVLLFRLIILSDFYFTHNISQIHFPLFQKSYLQIQIWPNSYFNKFQY